MSTPTPTATPATSQIEATGASEKKAPERASYDSHAGGKRPNPIVNFLTLRPLASGGVRDMGLLVLRVCSLMLVPHGVKKLDDYEGFVGMLSKNPVGSVAPDLFGFMVVAGEILLPIFLFLGLYTRWCGLLQVTMFAFIIGAVDVPNKGWFSEHGGFVFEPAMLFLLMGLALFFFGAGRFSADHALNRSEG